MHRDLDPAAWPEGGLTESPLLAGLLAEGFDGGTSIFGPDDKLDVLLDPADIIQVVDADASQTKVIEEVRRGSNLVVQGPPGTGKSQTITNIIAAAAHDGKSVLFVAEKMAALSVVHHRLVRSGLRDICLELHSRSANKKALAQELGRTLMASAAAVPEVSDVTGLRHNRDELNRVSDLLHEPVGGSSDTPFLAMSEIIGLIGRGAQPPSMPLNGLEKLGLQQRKAALQAIARFVEALKVIGAPEVHPYRGVAEYNLQPTDLSRLVGELEDANTAVTAVSTEAASLATSLGRDAASSLADVRALIVSLEVLASAPEQAKDLVTENIFNKVSQPRLIEALSAGLEWVEPRRTVSYDFGVLNRLNACGKIEVRPYAQLPKELRPVEANTLDDVFMSCVPEAKRKRADSREAMVMSYQNLKAQNAFKVTDGEINRVMSDIRDGAEAYLFDKLPDPEYFEKLSAYQKGEGAKPRAKSLVELPAKVSASTLRKWTSAYSKGGKKALLDRLDR